NKITQAFEDNLKGKRFALWGLAFKPNTDDMREAPSRVIIEALLKRGATICAYDPVASEEAKRILGDSIHYASRAVDALEGADALIIVTEWKEFRSPSFEAMAQKLKSKRIFDGRNLYDPSVPGQYGLIYEAVGRKVPVTP
ncbi:MAG: UDP-glucose/GDP-mannose dehydrogenase family protein, partial [Betaproteobacteria bacterium]|nr:UDP-glucose/GDP-mannose dehydrogenase family protein [Betaproteobacteria bacterium]